MGSFDWIELDTLTREIEQSRSRLDAARATNNHGLVTLLQREIAEKSGRRSRVLLDITKALGISAKTKLHSGPVRAIQTQATDAEHTSNEHQGEGHRAEHGEPGTTEGIRPPEALQQTVVKEGVADMWNQVKAADIEFARGAVAKRLSEMLARHAEELRALDTEQREIDAVEQAINAFAQKFKIGGAEVVPFDLEHTVHSQAG